MPNECEVSTQIFCSLLDVMLRSRLVVQEAELECSFSLWLVQLRLLVAKVEHFHEVFDSLACLICLREGLSKELVRFNLFFAIASLLAKFQELLPMLHSSVQFTLRLINHSNLLITLCLNVLVLSTLSNGQAFLEELEWHIKLILLKVFIRNELINTYQVFWDCARRVYQVSTVGLFESCLKMRHSWELVEDLLFADTKATISLSFSLNILKLDWSIKAALVKVWSRFIIIHLLVHMRHLQVYSETVSSSCIAMKHLTRLQIVTDLH